MNAWPNNKLREIADNIARHQAERIPDLERELQAAQRAVERAETFPDQEGIAYCPKCWSDGHDAQLVQTKREDAKRLDMYHCRRCGSDFPMAW